MHPFVKILTFIFTLLLMSIVNSCLLAGLCFGIAMLAVTLNFKSFWQVLKRMRLFFLSIFLIYALGTPGEYVWLSPASIVPTYEGLNLGLMQIEKLVISLAALSILFATSAKEHLLLGLYVLLSPLKYLGLSVERFTARLLLTLDYVEVIANSNKPKLVFRQLDDIHADKDELQGSRVIALHAMPYHMLDRLLISGFCCAVLAYIAFKVLS